MIMKDSHLAHILRNRAEKYKNREAFRFKKDGVYESTSWESFKNNSDSVSKFLLSLGIDTDAKVGIYSQNVPEWTICDFGILSIRAVVVPIYPTASYSQLEYIINETEMEVLCVGENEQLPNALIALDKTKTLKKLITFNCDETEDKRVISFQEIIKAEYEDSINEKLNLQLKNASLNDLATIIYTSGTTGEPKGVMLDYNNFNAVFRIHKKRLTLTEDDVSMCFLPLSHVFERAWTYFVVYSGAVNVYNLNPRAIIDELAIVKPTVMCSVPRLFEKTYQGIYQKADTWPKIQKSIFNWSLAVGLKYIEYQKDSKNPPLLLKIKRGLANALVMKKIRLIFGGNIHYMPCAGSAISSEILRFFHAMGVFVNYGYGATETTATVSCMRHDIYDFENTGSIMPEVEVKISETDGMILVKGESVFKGYYKKPEETAETLKDGWYYTGDMGEIPKEGTLKMTERLKDIIKSSTGKYISPQKIELIVSQSPLVEQMSVIGDNQRYLTALIAPDLSALKKLAEQKGLVFDNDKLDLEHPSIIETMKETIDSLLSELPSHEQIVKFKLIPELFTIENGLLTNSLKIKRKHLETKYAEAIKAMY